MLRALPPEIWSQLDEVARLRIENKLIASVNEGKFVRHQKRCTGGALGTWAPRIIHQFTLKADLWQTLFSKLGRSDPAEQDYAFEYFIPSVDDCFDAPPPLLIAVVKRGLEAGDQRFKELAEGWKWTLHEERDPEHPWRKTFAEALANFTPAAEAVMLTDDDVPF